MSFIRSEVSGGRVLVAIALGALLAGCGGSSGGTGPGPTPVSANKARLRVEVIGYGNGNDADGFSITVGGATRTASWNGAVTFDSLSPGAMTVGLSGVASHCQADSSTAVATVTAATVDTIRFPVGCFGDLAFDESDASGGWHLVYMDPQGVMTRLTNGGGRQLVQQWSPDGTRLTYQTNERAPSTGTSAFQWDLGVVTVATGQALSLAVSPQADVRPRWSPDSRSVAYGRWYLTDTTNGNGTVITTVRVVNSDGTADRMVLDSVGEDIDPDWILGGTALAFGCNRLAPLNSICRVAPSGSVATLSGFAGSHTSPQKINRSPDGSWISFLALDSPYLSIWTVAASGSGTSAIRLAPGMSTYLAAWSADGLRLAVNTIESSTVAGLRVVNRDGSGLTGNLTPFSPSAATADWSADGRWLVVSAVDSAAGQHLYVMRPDGTGRRQLTFASPQLQFLPLWRPGSAFIAPPASR